MSQEESKDSLIVIQQHPFIPNTYDFYQLLLSTMTVNQIKQDVHLNRLGTQNERYTFIHDTLSNSIAKTNLWCTAQRILNPNCMVDDRFLIMRKDNVLNKIDYVQDTIESSLLLTDQECSDFSEVDNTLNMASSILQQDIISISPQGNMFCLFDPITRTVYGGALKPHLKLLFRIRVPLINEQDLVHMLPADNMSVYIVPGHGLQAYFLRPMDVRTYVCMRFTLQETFRSSVSMPGSITRVNDTICYVPTIHGTEEDDLIVIDSYHNDLRKNHISIKKRMEKCKYDEEDVFSRPKKRQKFVWGARENAMYRCVNLIHDGNHLYCIQQPRYASMGESLRIVDVDSGTCVSIGSGTNFTVTSPTKKISVQTSPVRTSIGKRKRLAYE